MAKLKLSKAGPVGPTVELVQLDDLVDAAGNPFVVQCERFDTRAALAMTKRLPGARPKLGLEEKTPSASEADMEMALEVVHRLIESGTALAHPKSGFVRPAFYFRPESRPEHGLSLDGNVLSLGDVAKLATAIQRLNGLRGVGDPGTFRGRKRA